jgi:hypothetical protein
MAHRVPGGTQLSLWFAAMMYVIRWEPAFVFSKKSSTLEFALETIRGKSDMHLLLIEIKRRV